MCVLAVAAAVVLLAQPGADMAKKRIKRPKPMYGHGLNTLLDNVAPPPAQTTSNLAYSAFADADKWWEQQGAAPKPLQLKLVPVTQDREHLGFGRYGTGDVEMSNPYVQKVTDIANNRSLSRRGRVEALAGLWALSAHERGHNLGYEHQPSGVMAPDALMQIPGEAYTWAASMTPRKYKVRVRRRK